MGEEEALRKKRFTELAQRADAHGIYTHTGFLSVAEQATLASLRRALAAPYTLFGGMEGCERQMAQFGAPALCGYVQPLPIACVRVTPAGAKFADALTHRDFLGALMNLGIVRETLGDILCRDNVGYVFCTETIAPFILENLTQVKHTPVRCAQTQDLPADAAPKLVPATLQAQSERADGIVAKAYALSREDSQTLFQQGRVLRNSAPCARDEALCADDVVSVRGYGRFVYRGVTGTTRRGKLQIHIEKYEG